MEDEMRSSFFDLELAIFYFLMEVMCVSNRSFVVFGSSDEECWDLYLMKNFGLIVVDGEFYYFFHHAVCIEIVSGCKDELYIFFQWRIVDDFAESYFVCDIFEE